MAASLSFRRRGTRGACFATAGVSLLLSCGARTQLLCDHTVVAKPVPPTLYVVVDRSGSMAKRDWPAVRETLASVVGALGSSARIGLTLFPQPSSGVDVPAGDCAPGEEAVAPHEKVTADDVRAAMSTDPEGGSPLRATLEALTGRLLGVSTPGLAVVVVTDGGPNCGTSLSCDLSRCTANMDAVSECPRNGPNCCTPDGLAGPSACLDDDGTERAIAVLASRGIRTFVLGTAGSDTYTTTLEAMAAAGGTRRAAPPGYYRIDSTDAPVLKDTLASVLRAVAPACDLDFDLIPDQDTELRVAGARISYDASDGWTSDGQTRITLHGNACERHKSGGDVTATFLDWCITKP